MRRAIVVGGSLAGMCAARALADAYDEVCVVDRDEYPSTVESRAGLPQARHAHVLLDRGRRELDALFPGFSGEMLAGGAELWDPGLHIATRRTPGWQPVGRTGSELLWSSRDLLEFTVRGLLRAHPRVRFVERAQVLGLRTTTREGLRVSGVAVRDRQGALGELEASTVVDASGRETRANGWFSELGVEPPVAERVDSHTGYASRWYRAPAADAKERWWKGLWIEAEPPKLPRAGVLFPAEGDRWLVTLAGIGADAPPTDEPGFRAFMRTLRSPALARAVDKATPISPIAGSRKLANVYRRYDRWKTHLPGFLALGDAFCAFNPVYGQGMSVAATCAGLLRESLRDRDATAAGFEARFFQRQAAFVEQPWQLATRADFAWPETEGERPRSAPWVGDYMRAALRCTHDDLSLRRHINPVFNLTGSMALFFSPPFVARVLLATARRTARERLLGAHAVSDMPPSALPAQL